jgi:hypothetical protein
MDDRQIGTWDSGGPDGETGVEMSPLPTNRSRGSGFAYFQMRGSKRTALPRAKNRLPAKAMTAQATGIRDQCQS